MNNGFPLMPLNEILSPVSRPEVVEPQKTYSILGAHWYAEGLYTKDAKEGAQIRASKMYRVKEGDFVYNRLFAWKGAFAIAKAENHGCYVSNEFPCFTINQGRAHGQYLWRYFSRASAWDEALGLSSGGTPTSRNRLKVDKLLAMKIPLPPLSEQRRIVARIEELAARIEKARGLRQQAVEEAEALVNAELDNVFTTVAKRAETLIVGKEGGFVTSGPRGWGEYYNEDGCRRLIRVENVWNRELDLSTAARVALPDHAGDIERSEVKAGDVLVTITGAIGRVGVVRKFDVPCHVSQHVALVRPPKSVDSDYLYWFLQSPSLGRPQTEGKTYGATKPGINLTSLRKLQLPALPFSEQKSLAASFSKLQAKVNALKELQAETAAELDALLPSVLDRAFKGRL